jgi:hypothetical protein
VDKYVVIAVAWPRVTTSQGCAPGAAGTGGWADTVTKVSTELQLCLLTFPFIYDRNNVCFVLIFYLFHLLKKSNESFYG